MGYVPLSVREGGWRERLGWWFKGRREAIALSMAPWLSPAVRNKEWDDIAAAWREVAASNKEMQATGHAILSEAGLIPASFVLAQALRYRATLEHLLALRASTDGQLLVANLQARRMAEHALDDEYWSTHEWRGGVW